jgi:2-keto-4-pentenoate hydratase
MDPSESALADWLEARLAEPSPVPEILTRAPELTPAGAYRLQQAVIERRVARGDRLIGYKAALTSKAMQQYAGVNEPVLGTLLGSRLFGEEAPVSLGGFFKAALEPEVGVLLKGDLAGPGVTPLDALGAIAGYLPAVEIGDIRTGDNPRSIQQTIACNTFNGGHVFGAPLTAPHGIDLRVEGMVLSLNGELRGSATAVEVLGDPLNSVVFMANRLAERGLVLKAGMVLLTGSIVKSIPVRPGDEARVRFTRLGEVRVRFAD